MKIPPSSKKAYQQIKEQLKQKLNQSKQEAQERIKQAADYVTPKAKETVQKAANWVEETINDPKIKEKAQKAADWTGDRIDDAKETYEKLKQKYAEYTMEPPKLDVLRQRVTELQKKVLFKSAFLSGLKSRAPEQTMLIYQRERELQKLKKEAQIAIDKYNKFAARQAAVQQAFERLNNF